MCELLKRLCDAETKVKVMKNSGFVMSDSPAGLGKAVLKAIEEWK